MGSAVVIPNDNVSSDANRVHVHDIYSRYRADVSVSFRLYEKVKEHAHHGKSILHVPIINKMLITAHC